MNIRDLMNPMDIFKPSGTNHVHSFTSVFGPPNSEFQTLERAVRSDPAVPETSAETLQATFDRLKVFDECPNLQTFKQFMVRDSNPVLKRPFLRGRSLHEIVLTLGPQSKASCLSFAKIIASALETVHAHGVAMCSLTLDNCILVNGSLVIVDFGYDFIFRDSVERQGTVESLAMRGPEGVHDTAPPSMKLDIWHFGLLLHALLTGAYPWKTRNQGRIMNNMCENAVPVDESLDEDIVTLLKQMFSSDPQARPTAAEIRQRIEGILASGNLSSKLPRLPAVAVPRAMGLTMPQVTAIMSRSRGRILQKHPSSATPEPVKLRSVPSSLTSRTVPLARLKANSIVMKNNESS